MNVPPQKRHTQTKKKIPTCFSGALCSSFFHLLRLLNFPTKLTIQSLLLKGTLILFYHLLGHGSNWIEMKRIFFLQEFFQVTEDLRVAGVNSP